MSLYLYKMKLINRVLLMFSMNRLKQIPSNLKGKNSVSQKWLKRHLNDPYVKEAHIQNLRCRSAFKLLEINKSFNILKPGQVVIDCGAAPGSWSQVCVDLTNSDGQDPDNPKGKVIGVDLQHISPISGATLLSDHDMTSNITASKIMEILQDRKADVVVSDMAPNATGVKQMDHEIIIDLCMKTLMFSCTILADGGTFLCKIWQGSQQKNLVELLQVAFQSVQFIKPEASRKDSSEAFILARNFKHKLK